MATTASITSTNPPDSSAPQSLATPTFDAYCLTSIRCAARRLIGRYGIRRQDLEDIEQDLILNLLPRLSDFDPAKGMWSTFVKNAVANATSSLVRHRCAQRRVPGRRVTDEIGDEADHQDAPSLQNAGLRALMQIEDPATRDDEARCDLHLDMHQAMNDLTPLQRDVCAAVMRHSKCEAARILGISRWKLLAVIDEVRAVFVRAGITLIAR